MRLICPQCHAQYTIGDDKIHRERIKTRCKRCGTTIEIAVPDHVLRSQHPIPAKEGTPAAPNQSPLGQAPTMQAEAGIDGSVRDTWFDVRSPGVPGTFDQLNQSTRALEASETEPAHWYVAISEKPVGPISARKVHAYCRTGQVNDESLVWKEGMPGWVAFRSSDDLVGLIAKIKIEKLETTLPPAPDGPRKFQSFQQPGQGAPLKGLHVDEIRDLRDTDPDGPAGDRVSTTPLEATGSGEIPGLTDAKQPQDWDMAERDIEMIRALSPPTISGNRVYLFASVGFFITAMITLVVVIFGGSRATGEPQSVKTVEKIVEKVVYRDRVVEREHNLHEEGKPESATALKSAAGKRLSKMRGPTADAKPQKSAEVDERTLALMERLSGPAGMNRAIGSAPINRPSSGGAPAAGLSSAQMKNVVDKNKGALKACYERALKKGEAPEGRDVRVNFKLKVGESGLVRQANLSGEGAKLPSLNKCLTLSVKKWVFPPSTGASDMEFPFVFTPTR